jgi:UTP-glucose-1-phosphate uridylyltransferase
MTRLTRRTKKDETIALVSRVYIGELPYIKYFLDYYIKIGVDKIYLIVTNKAETHIIKNYLNEYIYILNFIINETRTIDMRLFNMKNINIDIHNLDFTKPISFYSNFYKLSL